MSFENLVLKALNQLTTPGGKPCTGEAILSAIGKGGTGTQSMDIETLSKALLALINAGDVQVMKGGQSVPTHPLLPHDLGNWPEFCITHQGQRKCETS